MNTLKTRMGEGGRIVIPVEYRRALGLEPGDEVILVLDDGDVRIMTPQRAVQRAQALVRRYIPEELDLVDELLQERRDEVTRG